MHGHSDSKLQLLLAKIPNGFLVDSRWMRKHHITRQSVYDYVQRGWLETVMPGLYRRPFGPSDNEEAITGWKIPLLSAQWLMGYDIHLGGMSALAHRGYDHYLSLGERKSIYLYGQDMPSWMFRLSINGKLQKRSTRLFRDPSLAIDDQKFALTDSEDTLRPWEWPIKTSTPERAILEALDELPTGESWHQIDMIFQGLANLRPGRLNSLLTTCTSIKVKRLFLVFAERHHHAWAKHVEVANIDIGKGDRGLVKGGKLHPKYRITVPADIWEGERFRAS